MLTTLLRWLTKTTKKEYITNINKISREIILVIKCSPYHFVEQSSSLLKYSWDDRAWMHQKWKLVSDFAETQAYTTSLEVTNFLSSFCTKLEKMQLLRYSFCRLLQNLENGGLLQWKTGKCCNCSSPSLFGLIFEASTILLDDIIIMWSDYTWSLRLASIEGWYQGHVKC